MRTANVLKSLLLAFAVFGSFGATDCEYYADVTVPSSDGTRPGVTAFVYDIENDSYAGWNESGRALNYAVGYDDAVVLVASATDAGGMKSLRATWYFDYQCCYSNGSCNKNRNLVITESYDSQPGSTGSRVSNGIYLSHTFGTYSFSQPSYLTPRAYLTNKCGSNARYSKMSLDVEAVAVDFKNNTTVSPRHGVHYN